MFGISKILGNHILLNAVKNICCTQKFVRYGSNQFDRQFVVVRVKPKDYETVINLFRYSFFNGEPTMIAAGLSYKRNPVLESKVLECLSLGMSLMALCRKTGNIVGAAVNCGLCPWDPDITEDFANACTCPKMAEVLRFYAYVSRMPNLWEKFNEHKIFEISYLATDINNQGKGIGQNLIKKSIELGKDLTYNVIRVDATNFFTQKICQNLKMHKVFEIPYRKYVDCNGKPIFLPPAPHESVHVYVALPHASPEYQRKLLEP